jgi:UDP-GlcNAc:undecaprenyl-phosphate/decaprenyl-phosphate GlcNAc-1-phosphate transferase
MTLLHFLSSAVLSSVIIFLALRSPIARRILDQPGRLNSMHATPIPRIGGAALLICVFAVAWFTNTAAVFVALLGTAFALTVVSIVDDTIGLPAWLRLIAHLLAATFVTFSFLDNAENLHVAVKASQQIFVFIAVILVITWSTNLFNFMDGADGLAGGMTLFGFGAYAIAASQLIPTSADAAPVANLCAITAGAALGFLFFNFSPAKVFMGDAGSIPLGFLAATLGINGVSRGLWAWWFPLLVFSPFIVDATTTLMKRILRGEKIWVAHRQHYYHRLILSGWNHRRVALSYYGLMAACTMSAFMAQRNGFTAPLLAFWVVTYLILVIFLERYLTSKRSSKDSG